MRNPKYFSFLIIFVFALNFLCAQSNPVDSLKNLLKTVKDKEHVDVLIKIGRKLRSKNPAEAEKFYSEAVTEAKKIAYNDGFYTAAIGLGRTYNYKHDFPKAVEYLSELFTSAKKSGNQKWIIDVADALATIYANIANDKIIFYASEIEKAATVSNDLMGHGLANKYFAQAYYNESSYKKATDHFEKARDYFRLANDKGYVAGMTMNLGILYFKRNEFAKSIENYSSALEDFKKDKDTINMANCITNIGISERDRGDLKKAKIHLDEALHIYENMKDSSRISMCLENIAINESRLGNSTKALQLLLESVKIHEAMSSNEHELATNYNNLSNFLRTVKQYQQAKDYYKKALFLFKKIGDKDREATAYTNYASILGEEGKIDSAIFYINKSMEINLANEFQDNLSGNYYNLGTYYNRINKKTEALEYFNKALELKVKTNDKLDMPGLLSNIGTIYFENEDYKKALDFYKRSIQMFEETGVKEDVFDVYKCIAKCYSATGDFKNAYKYQALYTTIKDSLLNSEITRQLAEMSEKFESDKKQKEISLLTKDSKLKSLEIEKKQSDLKKQRLIIIISVVGLLMFVLLSVLIFRALKQNQKAKIEISLQKQVIEVKQKEVLDSINYAKRIQSAIIPTLNYVKQNLPLTFIFYKPKDIVAGDFYWMEKKNDSILIAAADCTGHGVPGAMVSVVCSNALNQSVNEFGITDPGKILDKTRELVLDTFSKSDEDVKDGMDISLIKIEAIKEKKLPQGKLIIPKGQTLSDVMDTKTKFKIEWAGANNPLWYFKNDELIEVKAHKQAIGKVYEPSPFPTNTFELSKGDIFYLFTDGFADQFGGENGKKYKASNMKKLLESLHHEPMEQQQAKIKKTFEDWKGNLEQVDDVCVIGIRL